jgi:proline dehydrogenase
MEQQAAVRKKLTINFDDTEKAFRHKSIRELKEAAWMFKMLNHRLLGELGKRLLKFSVKIGLPVKPFIKATLYKHFVGGETLEDCLPLVEKLAKSQVLSILDYSEEAKEHEEEIEAAFQELLRNVKFAGEHDHIPLTVFKPTAICSSDLLEKVSSGKELTLGEADYWKIVRYRFDQLCNTAFFSKVPIMIDAEESWIQLAIDDLALEMMRKYNKDRVTVINTFQMYRKDRLAYLMAVLNTATEENFRVGAKLVRGAYMEKERARAKEMGYQSPIQNTKADTDRDYNEAVTLCMKHLDKVFLVVATHNEYSSCLAAELIQETAYKNDHPYLWFSQLLGMCDHVSFTLAAHGFNVAKYVPYGPVKAVTPYLIRRADENSSVAGQAVKEMGLLHKEIRRRKQRV